MATFDEKIISRVVSEVLARLVMAHLKSDRSPLVFAAKALLAEADPQRDSATPEPARVLLPVGADAQLEN